MPGSEVLFQSGRDGPVTTLLGRTLASFAAAFAFSSPALLATLGSLTLHPPQWHLLRESWLILSWHRRRTQANEELVEVKKETCTLPVIAYFQINTSLLKCTYIGPIPMKPTGRGGDWGRDPRDSVICCKFANRSWEKYKKNRSMGRRRYLNRF